MRDPHAELEDRRDMAARLEQERTDLQLEIEAFRRQYLARVGPAQAELEALELHIAEYRLRNELVRLRGAELDAHKLEVEVEWQLRGRRAQYEGYYDSVAQAARSAPPASGEPDPEADRSLKALYRDLAKRAHPDLVQRDADRAARDALMAEINAAYAQQDAEALQAIAARLRPLAEAIPPDPGAEMARLDTLIAGLRADIAELNRSDWLAMKLDAALARARGLDWFAHARREIEARIGSRRQELDDLIAEFRDLVSQARLA